MLDTQSLSYPPTVGPDWLDVDRLAYIAWASRITLHRIDLDDPAVPLLSKRPIRDLFAVVVAVATWTAEDLEAERPRLLKPYNPAEQYHGVHVPGEWLELLAELAQPD